MELLRWSIIGLLFCFNLIVGQQSHADYKHPQNTIGVDSTSSCSKNSKDTSLHTPKTSVPRPKVVPKKSKKRRKSTPNYKHPQGLY